MVTSAITIAEVYFVRLSDGRIVPNRDKDIDALFAPPLILVETSRLTAYSARDVARKYGVSPTDAIHVASALEARCQVMHTNEKALWDKSGKVGGDPVLKIEAPAWTRQMTVVENPDGGTFTALVDPTEPQPPFERSPADAQE